MPVTFSQRTIISQDVPSRLMAVELPPGVTLEKYIETETERLRTKYPEPKITSVELGPELAESLAVARYQRALWEEKYQLIKLAIREELGFAKKGLNGGVPFVDRRIFPVHGYEVENYTQDAIFPL